MSSSLAELNEVALKCRPSVKHLTSADTFLQKAGIKPECHLVKSQHAAQAISDFAQSQNVDAIVMESQGYGHMTGALLGSVARDLLKDNTIPLMIIREAAVPAPNEPLRIGICVDGSAMSLAAARFVAEHPEFVGTDAVIHLIYVSDDFDDLVDIGHAGANASVANKQKQQFVTSIEPVKAILKGFKVLDTPLTGKAGEAIADYAQKENLDMVVMGSCSYQHPAYFLFGSTCDKVARLCKVPLMIIRRE